MGTGARVAAVVLLWVASFGGVAFAGADAELEVVVKERDQLRNELAMAKLKIAELEGKLEAAGLSSQPDKNVSPTSTQKEWIVEITSMLKPDVAAVQRKLDAERESLNRVSERLGDAESRAADAANARGEDVFYQSEYDDRGNYRRIETRRHSARQKQAITDTARTRDSISREVAQAKSKVLQIEQELQKAKSTRSIDGKLDDGTAVKVTTLPTSLAAADAMVVGKKYKITGSTVTGSMVFTIVMRTAVAQ